MNQPPTARRLLCGKTASEIFSILYETIFFLLLCSVCVCVLYSQGTVGVVINRTSKYVCSVCFILVQDYLYLLVLLVLTRTFAVFSMWRIDRRNKSQDHDRRA